MTEVYRARCAVPSCGLDFWADTEPAKDRLCPWHKGLWLAAHVEHLKGRIAELERER